MSIAVDFEDASRVTGGRALFVASRGASRGAASSPIGTARALFSLESETRTHFVDAPMRARVHENARAHTSVAFAPRDKDPPLPQVVSRGVHVAGACARVCARTCACDTSPRRGLPDRIKLA